jgi:hypothetical protein
MLYGAGKYTYELVDGWPKYPEGYSMPDIGSVAIDAQDRVYILNLGGDHPMIVFDRDGNLLTSWGEGYFNSGHGCCIGPDGSVYCTDCNSHTVSKFTPEGKLLNVMGKKDKPSDTGYIDQRDFFAGIASIKYGGPPFNRPTDVAVSASGEIYVSDGYSNARVHKFAPDGTLVASWGEPGYAPGEFRIPHAIWVDKQDKIWVADRENSRIQIFNSHGELLNQWTGLNRPNDLYIDQEGVVYVAESSQQVSIFHPTGDLIVCFGSRGQGIEDTALFMVPHTIAVDSHGDIYVGECALTAFGIDRGPRSIHKFVRKV